jgi:aspartyl protease family protein
MADSTDQMAHGIWLLLFLLLVGSSLISRRLPMARLLAWSAGWVVLFLGAYLLFSWLQPTLIAWQQSRRGGDVVIAQPPSASPPVSGSNGSVTGLDGTVKIPMQEDGHYWVDATVNGQTVRFLIDSGASVTSLSQNTANRLGITVDTLGTPMAMDTANGTIQASRATIPQMQIGVITASDLPVAVSPSFGNIDVLGMNFLGKLKSWRVEEGVMVLEGRQ